MCVCALSGLVRRPLDELTVFNVTRYEINIVPKEPKQMNGNIHNQD